MKTAICYYSHHHGNTMQVLEAMAQEQEIDLINVTSRIAAHLEQYDCIGFASGIYYSKFHETVVDYARHYKKKKKKVFLVCTHGSGHFSGKYIKDITEAVGQKGSELVGTFSCRGYDTFGPFGWIGGIAKGHPDEQELQMAKDFIRQITAG